MRFLQPFVRSRKLSHPRRPAPRPRKRTALKVEQLEDRCVPSVTLDSSGNLFINCDSFNGEDAGRNQIYVSDGLDQGVLYITGTIVSQSGLVDSNTFLASQVNHIYADDNVAVVGAGFDVFYIQQTLATAPVSVNYFANTGRPGDIVVIGNNSSVQGVQGTVDIYNPNFTNSVYIDDSADPAAHTAYLFSFNYPDNSTPFGTVRGLAPADIHYVYGQTSQVTIDTSLGGGTVNVETTGTTTNLVGAGTTTVLVTDQGSVQGIQGTLNVENPASKTILMLDDSADPTPLTVTTGTFVNSADSETNTDPWGYVHGLAPAAINYEDADLSSVTLKTGSGTQRLYFQAPQAVTNLIGDAQMTVYLGANGSLQGFKAPLYIDNKVAGGTTLIVHGEADTIVETATLESASTSASGEGALWIHGLPVFATVYYSYAATSEVSIYTSTASGDQINILATGVPTMVVASGTATVDVGMGSLAAISAPVNVTNTQPNATTLTVDGSQDTFSETVTLTNSRTSSVAIIAILVGTPVPTTVQVSYDYPSTASLTVQTSTASGDVVDVYATSVTTNLALNGVGTVDAGMGTVAGLMDTLNIQDSQPGGAAVTLDDSADSAYWYWSLESSAGSNSSTGSVVVSDNVSSMTMTVNYNYAGTSSFSLLTSKTNGDQINILATGVPTMVVASGTATVDVGAGSLAAISAPVNVRNTLPNATTLKVDGSQDTFTENVTLANSSASSGAIIAILVGTPVPTTVQVSYDYPSTASLTLDTSSAAGDQVVVQATGVATTVQGDGPTAVDVGNGSLAQISAPVMVTNKQQSATTLKVDGSQDTFTENVTLATSSASAGSGAIIAILIGAPAPTTAQISINYLSTANVTVCTSWAAGDEIDALGIGVPTTLQGNGPSTVDVGKGSLQGIMAPVTVTNKQASATQLIVDDSTDTGMETATFASTSTAANEAEIVVTKHTSGAAPVVIAYPYAATASVTLDTSAAAGDVIDVLQTGVVTNLLAPNTCSVQVGLGNLRGIRGALYIQDAKAKGADIWVDDATDPDPTPDTVTLSTFWVDPWTAIAGMAPAAINCRDASTKSLWLKASSANDTFLVNAVPLGPSVHLAGASGTADTLVGPNVANT